MEQRTVECDVQLKDYDLPKGTLVMLVKRDNKYMVPNGKLLLKKGDKLLLISQNNEGTEG